jgi:hypothetical protein
MADITIREILDLVPRGQIRIPAFQRGFVWDPEQVAFLMDSVYKNYPFGSLLFWRTKEQLKFERKLGPFSLPKGDPDYPIDYVLDGQQRITSLFGVFQSTLNPDGEMDWADIYFDLGAAQDAQESQFLALDGAEADPRRHFPLKVLFSSIDYRRATQNLGEKDIIRIDDMQARFKEARIPFQLLTTEDRARVAIVFERINRTGVPLDTLQLLTAWTWSEDFDLQREFDDLREELEPFGFAGVGEDSNLLLRCCAAVLAQDASPARIVSLRGADVRARFDEITNGVRGAIDFLRQNLLVETVANLPFSTILVPLSVFFAGKENQMVKMTDAQRARLIRWFWRACFARRYSSGVLRALGEDITAMAALKEGKPNALGDFPVVVTRAHFATVSFRVNTVATKTFILMLAQQRPRSFISGQHIALAPVLKEYNRSEFHHLYPAAYLRDQGVPGNRQGVLANFCFLSKVDNIQLGGAAPSVYRGKMAGNHAEILAGALCPASLFNDDFGAFIAQRSAELERIANQIIS